jgi:hypothetical protein
MTNPNGIPLNGTDPPNSGKENTNFSLPVNPIFTSSQTILNKEHLVIATSSAVLLHLPNELTESKTYSSHQQYPTMESMVWKCARTENGKSKSLMTFSPVETKEMDFISVRHKEKNFG